jgi:NTE family protein
MDCEHQATTPRIVVENCLDRRVRKNAAIPVKIHKLRHVISELVQKLPDEMRKMPDVHDLAGYGCRTRMHVVRLVSPLAGEDHSKDIDFSTSGIRLRWDAGYTDTVNVLAQAPWAGDFDPLEGFILHETEAGRMKFEG